MDEVPAPDRPRTGRWTVLGVCVTALATPIAYGLWAVFIGFGYQSVHYPEARFLLVHLPLLAVGAVCGWLWPPQISGGVGVFAGLGLAVAAHRSWMNSYYSDGLEIFGVVEQFVLAAVAGLATVMIVWGLRHAARR